MSAMGLQALEITDNRGIVLSSGHHRNDFGGRARGMVRRLLESKDIATLAWFRRSNGYFLCLSALHSVNLGHQTFHIIGGIEVSPSFLRALQPDTAETIILKVDDVVFSSMPHWENGATLPNLNGKADSSVFIAEFDESHSLGGFKLPVKSRSSAAEAGLYLLRPKTELTQLLQDLNKHIGPIIAGGILIAIVLSIWRSRAVAKPLGILAETAGDLSLDRLEVDFAVRSNDEVGVLNEALRGMVQRLRQSRIELADTEQRAALAEIALQVNHDIKNGFIPIRNVMNHWVEVLKQEPHDLVRIFNERKATVLDSLNYLENLAQSYSRLRPATNLQAVNVNQVVNSVLQSYEDLPQREIQFEAKLDPTEPRVQADAVQLRRAFENVLRNALDALGERGRVSVCTQAEGGHVLILWHDDGAGIPEEIRRQLFKSHVSTKPGGTGLGLPNVKRIIEEFGGKVALESENGKGTTVRLTLPQMNGRTKGEG